VSLSSGAATSVTVNLCQTPWPRGQLTMNTVWQPSKMSTRPAGSDWSWVQVVSQIEIVCGLAPVDGSTS